MEIKVESKIGKLHYDEKYFYSFLSDCNNFQQFAVTDKVKNWQSDSESCSFSINGIGEVRFRIVDKEPDKMVKFSIETAHAENIFLWVQLKNIAPGNAKIKLTAKLDVNPVMQMFISKPLKQGLDKIIDTLENIY
jgi:hypothetical protein